MTRPDANILTVTLNPAVDMSYQLDDFHLDTVNRVAKANQTAGGKGLNVSRVLNQLEANVTATGFLGGRTGQFILDQLASTTIKPAFVDIAGETRHCIAILHGGQQTEILEAGPQLSDQEADQFLSAFEEQLKHHQVVVLSGSLPQGLPTDYYARLVGSCHEEGVAVVLDCSGSALEAVLKSPIKPTVIKPNREELAQLLGHEVTAQEEDLKTALTNPLFERIDWVIVSLGGDGAFAKHGETFYRVTIPKIKVVNPVGSGDSMVAGLAFALSKKSSDHDLLTTASVLGMLNAQEEATGFVNLANFDDLFEQIEVREV